MPEESEVLFFRTPSPLRGLTLRSALLGKAKASVVAKFVPTRAKEKFTCILPSAAEVRISKQRLLRVVPLIQEGEFFVLSTCVAHFIFIPHIRCHHCDSKVTNRLRLIHDCEKRCMLYVFSVAFVRPSI